MILSTLGMPCRFSEWCERLLAALLEDAADTLMADSLDQAGRYLLQRRLTHAVHISRAPRQALARALADGGHPFLVTLAPPQAAVAELIADHGLGLADAVRAIANAMTAILPVMDCPRALVLRPGGDDRDTATAIARHFGLAMDRLDAALETAHRDLPPAALAPAASPAIAGFEAISGHSILKDVERALLPLWRALGNAPLEHITWPASLFFLGDDPRNDAARLINVTGSSRCLVYGPYIRLTEGPWACSLMLGLSGHAAGLKLVAEIFAGDALTRVAFQVAEGGIFETEFSFVNSHPDHPIEVRLFNETASFEGEILLAQAQLMPLKARRVHSVIHG